MQSKHSESASASAPQKKTPLDEDIDQDFLTSWKLGKIGDNLQDFDMEPVPNKGKNTFNFGNFDDFDLSGNFGKMSSFKVDMPDIDFSTPPNKVENPKEKKPKEKITEELEKHEMITDKFNFAFEFNELDRFSFDSDLLIDDKKLSKSTDGGEPDCSVNLYVDSPSSRNSDLSMGSLGKKLEVNSSSPSEQNLCPAHPMVPVVHISDPVTLTDPVNNDAPHGEVSPSKEQITGVRIKNDFCYSEQPRELVDKEANLNVAVEIIPCDSSEQKFLPKLDGVAPSDPMKFKAAAVQSNRTVNVSISRRSSPTNPNVSRCQSRTFQSSLLNMSNELQKPEGKENSLNGVRALFRDSMKSAEVEKADADASLKNPHELRITEEKQKTCRKAVPLGLYKNVSPLTIKEKPSVATQMGGSSLKKLENNAHEQTSITSSKLLCSAVVGEDNSKNPSATIVKRNMCSLPTKERVSVSTQSLTTSLKKLESNAYKPTEAFSAKGLYSIPDKEIGTKISCLTAAKRDSKPGTEQAKNHNGTIPNPIHGEATKNPTISESKRQAKSMDTSRFQLASTSITNQSSESSMAKVRDGKPNQLLGISYVGGLTASAERRNVHLKGGKENLVPSLESSRVVKLRSNTCDFTKGSETRFPSAGSLITRSAASEVASRVLEHKQAFLCSPLKRKAPEELKTCTEDLHPSKRFMESPGEIGKFSEVSAHDNSKKNLTPMTKDAEATPDHAASTNFDLPVIMEEDGHIEKAEAWSRDLDNVCAKLKKMREEAKELLVRAVVINNSLLMLNHPMMDEKIGQVKELAARLQFMEL